MHDRTTTELAVRRRAQIMAYENGFPRTNVAGLTRDQESALGALKKARLHEAEMRVYTVDTQDSMLEHLRGIESRTLLDAKAAETLGREVVMGTNAKFASQRALLEDQNAGEIGRVRILYSDKMTEAEADLMLLHAAGAELARITSPTMVPVEAVPSLAAYINRRIDAGVWEGVLEKYDNGGDYANTSPQLAGTLRRDLAEARRKLKNLKKDRANEIERAEVQAKTRLAKLDEKIAKEKAKIAENLSAPSEFLRGERQRIDLAGVPPVLREPIQSVLRLRAIRANRAIISQRGLIERKTDIELACRETARELAKLNQQRRGAKQSYLDATAEVESVFDKWLRNLAELRGTRRA